MKSPLDTAREFHASVQSTGMPPGPGETLGDWLSRSLTPMADLIARDRAQAVREALDTLAGACERRGQAERNARNPGAAAAYRRMEGMIRSVADGLPMESEANGD